MSTINLLILGLVIERPSSAYDITREIDYREMTKWAKISHPAVYKNMPKLEAAGYLSGTTVKEGEMPDKVVYKITDEGYNYFVELMEKTVALTNEAFFNFTPVLTNIDKVEKAKADELIENIENSIEKELSIITEKSKNLGYISPVANSIISFYKGLFDYMITWLAEFKEAHEEERKLREK